MSLSFPQIILKQKSEKAFRKNKHPWVFSGAIDKKDSGIVDGAVVEICDSQGVVGYGIYDTQDRILVRMIEFGSVRSSQDFGISFWQMRWERAWDFRQAILDRRLTNGFRFLHSEGDECPGLVVDIYDSLAVIDCKSHYQKNLTPELGGFLKEKGITKLYTVYDGVLQGEEGFEFLENGFRFLSLPIGGQKTGFFLDQRDNRDKIRRYSAGRTVCNLFSYTGGFGVYAMAGGAKRVVNVDISQATQWAAEQIQEMNFGSSPSFGRFENTVADAFEYLRSMPQDGYDLIVLDPPAFTKSRATVEKAARGYKDINLQAMKKIRKGGILFTFSCSHFMDRELFQKVVFSAALDSGRKVRILESLCQAPDHPFLVTHPEGEYLKGFVLIVE